MSLQCRYCGVYLRDYKRNVKDVVLCDDCLVSYGVKTKEGKLKEADKSKSFSEYFKNHPWIQGAQRK